MLLMNNTKKRTSRQMTHGQKDAGRVNTLLNIWAPLVYRITKGEGKGEGTGGSEAR